MDITGALITVAVLAFFVVVIIFVLGAARVSGRAQASSYYENILHNIEIHAEFDREHRNG